MKSLLRIFAIMHKEILQLMRDRLTFGMIVGIPLIQLILFGYAINTDVRHLKAAVADQANTHLSREVIADIAASQVVDFIHQVGTAEQLEELLDAGKISLGSNRLPIGKLHGSIPAGRTDADAHFPRSARHAAFHRG